MKIKFTYIPKKSREIYNEIIAHRGIHISYPENSIAAYKEAISKKIAIELDIQMTKDGKIICIHDKNIKRLLKTKGKVKDLYYSEILNHYILNSNEKVPTFEEVLNLVNGKVTLLIEVKGYLNNEFEKKLIILLKDYSGTIYFHVENIFTFLKLKMIWHKKVFFILNPFRKRFNFIKSR